MADPLTPYKDIPTPGMNTLVSVCGKECAQLTECVGGRRVWCSARVHVQNAIGSSEAWTLRARRAPCRRDHSKHRADLVASCADLNAVRAGLNAIETLQQRLHCLLVQPQSRMRIHQVHIFGASARAGRTYRPHSVPRSYFNASAGQTDIAIARYRATDDKKRIGTLFINPGECSCVSAGRLSSRGP